MNLFRSFFLLLLFSVQCRLLHGQESSGISKNVLFAEYALEGPAYSINYGRIVASTTKINIDIRIGCSAYKNNLAFPFGAGIFTGKNQHHADFSLTITPLIEKKELPGGGTDEDKFIYLFPAAGYRYQSPSGGISLRAVAGPAIILDPAQGDFWNMDPKIKFSFSLSAGFSF